MLFASDCNINILQYKHPRSVKRVIRSDKPVTLLLLLWSHKCDFGAEPRSRIIATSAVKGLNCRQFSAHTLHATLQVKAKKKKKKVTQLQSKEHVLNPNCSHPLTVFNTHINPFTASCENAMSLSVPSVPASSEKFSQSSQ
jgi:hypothetical protein